MGSNFHENAIITGSIDYYCLACDDHLRCEEDARTHIAKPVHKKQLDSSQYLEKYKQECIRKVKKVYFCEFCNLLLPSPAIIDLHVADAKHNDNKGAKLLKRVGNAIYAFDDILINEKAWNGIIGDTSCVICDIEFDNEDIHKALPAHVLNLIQSELEFSSDKSIFRKVKKIFHCLTCNTLVSLDAAKSHYAQAEHKKRYQECREAKNANTASVDSTNKKISVDNNKDDITYTCTNSKEQKAAQSKSNVEKQIKNPVEVAKKPEKPTTSTATDDVRYVTDDEICDILGAKQYIADGNNGCKSCILCDWNMAESTVVYHVNGQHHNEMLKMHKERAKKRADTKREIENDSKELENVQLDRDNILDSVSEFQKNDMNINFVTGTASCKKCSEDIEFRHDSIQNHIDEHKKIPKRKDEVKSVPFSSGTEQNYNKIQDGGKNTSLFTSPVFLNNEKKEGQCLEKQDKSTSLTPAIPVVVTNKEKEKKTEVTVEAAALSHDSEDVENFAKQNKITFNRDNHNAFCRLCETRVPFSLRSLKEHVAGTVHKSRVTKSQEKEKAKQPVIIKKRMKDFIETMTTVRDMDMLDILLNEKYCINILSFLIITKHNSTLRCQLCEVTLTLVQIELHKETENHIEAMTNTPVITSLDSEFIREVRPKLYHCGYCNLIAGSWDDLNQHLKTSAHKEAKTWANWRLQRYKSDISLARRREEMELFVLMKILMNGNLF